jgi:Zn-finger nucleic acid-binding protein
VSTTCPRCRTPLAAVEYEGIAVDTCRQCGGEWMGADELRDIIDIRERRWDPKDLEALKRASLRGVPIDAVREDLPCPECGRAMEAFNYGGDSGIILDKCRECGGIWLDAGELEKVQMVVEAWEQALPSDLKRYGSDLLRVEQREERRAEADADSVRPGAGLATINQILAE